MPEQLSRILLAANFAAEKHRDQRRKDSEASPYINHPLAVGNVLLNEGGVTDPDIVIAALLHDTVEDTETAPEEIAELFGEDVCRLVGEVTDDKALPKVERKRLQVEKSPQKSDRAKQLKIADKICNVRDIRDGSPASWDIQRKVDYLDWAARVVEGCKGVNEKLDSLFDYELTKARSRL